MQTIEQLNGAPKEGLSVEQLKAIAFTLEHGVLHRLKAAIDG